MYLSIVIPAYNEEKRIGLGLSKIHSFLNTRKFEHEIIVSDDGSSDNTVLEVQKSALFKEGKVRIITSDRNKGKGAAVREGILNSYGEYVLFTDADLSTPIEELDVFFDYIKDGYDVVIGSRVADGSRVKIHQPWYRERMGKIFNFFVKIILFSEFNDTQCGFKLLRGDLARCLAKDMKIDGFCFDAELLYLAKRAHSKIAEVGISWENSIESKVRLIKSSLGMFIDLFKIRVIHKET